MEKKSSINLIKSQKGEMVERIIDWTLTIGRTLVIVTELLALGAFLYRFGLDAQIVDLHGKIKDKQEVITYLKPKEEAYRNLQSRLAIASSSLKIQAKNMTEFKNIIALAPQGVSFSNFSFTAKDVKITADTNSISSLSVFIQALKNYPSITDVSIDNIQNKTSTASINVGITASLK